MAQNTVEAKLVSSYTDRVSAGVERTKAVMQSQMRQMGASLSAFASAGVESFVKVIAAAQEFGRTMTTASREAGSASNSIKGHLLAVGVAAAGAAVALAAYMHRLMRDASSVAEMRIAYEGLAQAVGWSADTFQRLRSATQGLVEDAELLRNANKVLQAGVRLSSDQYVTLAANVTRLARTAGVDGVRALQALTESLIKGNAGSLQAIGLNLNVRDAISALAAATGQKAAQMGNAAKTQAFYNELLEQTRAAVSRLPEEFLSYDDMVRKVAIAWQNYQSQVAEAASRSGVLRGIFRLLNEELGKFVSSKSDLDAITLSTNRLLLNLVSGAARAVEALELLSYGWDVVWGVVKMSVNAQLALIGALTSVGAKMIGRFVELLAMVPGAVGQAARSQLDTLRRLVEGSEEFAKLAARDSQTAFASFGSNAAHLRSVADGLRQAETELQKYSDTVISGAMGTDAFSRSADAAGAAVKSLADQMKQFNALRSQMAKRIATPEVEAISRWADTLRQIEALTLISEEKKNMLRRAAHKTWMAEMVEIQRQAAIKAGEDSYKAFKEQEAMRATLVASWMADVSKLKLPDFMQPQKPSNLTDDPGYRAVREAELRRQEEWRRIQEDLHASMERNTPEWLKPYKELYAQLDRLNQLDLNPFQATLHFFRNTLKEIGEGITAAWSSLWADLVSGQETSGKKMIAGLINIVAQNLRTAAIWLTGLGMMWATIGMWSKAARHFAAAAAIGALGGILTGLAANMAQTRDAGAGGSFQQNLARPTSSQQVQVIQVGAAAGAQTPGAAATALPVQRVELVVRNEPGVIVREVSRNIRSNGELRTVIQGASA